MLFKLLNACRVYHSQRAYYYIFNSSKTEIWSGTSWSEVNDTNVAKKAPGGTAANSDAALGFGGETPAESSTAKTELWNGYVWTEVNDLNTAGYGLAASGTTTAALAFGRNPPATQAVTEDWNGASWVEVADLNAGRNALAGAGTTTASLAFGGTPPVAGATEEWSVPSNTIKVLTD